MTNNLGQKINTETGLLRIISGTALALVHVGPSLQEVIANKYNSGIWLDLSNSSAINIALNATGLFLLYTGAQIRERYNSERYNLRTSKP